MFQHIDITYKLLNPAFGTTHKFKPLRTNYKLRKGLFYLEDTKQDNNWELIRAKARLWHYGKHA